MALTSVLPQPLPPPPFTASLIPSSLPYFVIFVQFYSLHLALQSLRFNAVYFTGYFAICSPGCLDIYLIPSSLPFDIQAPKHGTVDSRLNHEQNHNAWFH